VAKVARCLATAQVNITHMSTSSRREPNTGTPIYNMRVSMDVPDTVDVAALRRELEAVAASLHIDLTLEPRQA
jgi:glycine cleavage system regulatory protein